MTSPKVSVVVVSQGRPSELRRCLLGINKLIYENFEVIVVADLVSINAILAAGLGAQVKICQFEEHNISAARNTAISLASGEIVAFIDDDSVPEPMWLNHLVAPFDDQRIDAAGGYVRGRNGISFQSKSSTIDTCGDETPLIIDGWAPKVFQGSTSRAIKTPGTNCAFRMATLLKLGGFDPAFRYYLDETDLNVRMGNVGCWTAIVPRAQVHHGFSPSRRRLRNRVPTTLFEVGSSMAVFLRKHTDERAHSQRLLELEAEKRKSLIEHMVTGNCEPCDIEMTLSTLRAGISDGKSQPISQPLPFDPEPSTFLPFPRRRSESDHLVVAGFRINSKNLHARARAAASRGKNVSLYIFSRTALFHRVVFHPDGYWVQTGGLFGKSDRRERLLKWYWMQQRIRKEVDRLSGSRFLDDGDELHPIGRN